MQRVHPATRGDRTRRRHQRLRSHLAAEHAQAILVGVVAAEDVDLELLDVEEPEDVIEQWMSQRAYQAVENPASGMSSALRSFDAIVRHLSSTLGSTKFA